MAGTENWESQMADGSVRWPHLCVPDAPGRWPQELRELVLFTYRLVEPGQNDYVSIPSWLEVLVSYFP